MTDGHLVCQFLGYFQGYSKDILFTSCYIVLFSQTLYFILGSKCNKVKVKVNTLEDRTEELSTVQCFTFF